MLARQHAFAALVEDFNLLRHAAEVFSFGVVFLGGDGDAGMDRVADEDGLGEAGAFVAVAGLVTRDAVAVTRSLLHGMQDDCHRDSP